MRRLSTVVLLIGLLVVGAAAPALASDCNSGRFCAFDGTNYVHPKLLDSGAAAGTNNVDVADDLVSSGKNRTGNRWCAVNNGFPGDDTIWNFAPNTNVSTLGSQNNKTDHFYVRTSAQNCT